MIRSVLLVVYSLVLVVQLLFWPSCEVHNYVYKLTFVYWCLATVRVENFEVFLIRVFRGWLMTRKLYTWKVAREIF